MVYNMEVMKMEKSQKKTTEPSQKDTKCPQVNSDPERIKKTITAWDEYHKSQAKSPPEKEDEKK